jgi:hypothetical protein
MEEPIRNQSSTTSSGLPNWVYGMVALLLLAATGAFYSAWSEHRRAEQLATAYDEMSVSLNQTRSKLELLAVQLEAQRPKPEGSKTSGRASSGATGQKAASRARGAAASSAGAKRTGEEEARWNRVNSALTEHEKRIAATQEALGRTREDLEGQLGATRTELTGSIARTREDLEELRKRGERHYYEFDLTKSKQFTRVGPLSLALRKAHTKKQYANLQLIVDDVRVEKKNINLYEPVLFYPADYAQPLELVINRIEKNAIHGYVSEPRFRMSELAAKPAETPAAPTAPAATSVALQSRPADAR